MTGSMFTGGAGSTFTGGDCNSELGIWNPAWGGSATKDCCPYCGAMLMYISEIGTTGVSVRAICSDPKTTGCPR